MPQVTLPGFSICVPVLVIRGLTRFLTMAEVAETAKTAWSSLTVWQFFMKRAKEANIIATRVSLDVGFRELKKPYKLKRENLVSLPLTGATYETVEIVDP